MGKNKEITYSGNASLAYAYIGDCVSCPSHLKSSCSNGSRLTNPIFTGVGARAYVKMRFLTGLPYSELSEMLCVQTPMIFQESTLELCKNLPQPRELCMILWVGQDNMPETGGIIFRLQQDHIIGEPDRKMRSTENSTATLGFFGTGA